MKELLTDIDAIGPPCVSKDSTGTFLCQRPRGHTGPHYWSAKTAAGKATLIHSEEDDQ